MLTPISFIFILSFLSAIFTFISQRHHILMSLLSLEASILTLALLISYLYSSGSTADLFFCLTVLTFGACEASVALATLVYISRSFGSDMFKSLSSNKC